MDTQSQDLGTPGSALLFTPDVHGSGGELDDFQLLSFAVRNERLTDDLLDYKHSLVERVQEQLQSQEALVEGMANDQTQETQRVVYTLGSHRMRYLLKAYSKARLVKIERYATAILDDEELQAKCSPKEVQYCLDYFVATGRCYKDIVLRGLPEEFQTLIQESQLTETKDILLLPKLDSYVFMKVLRDAGHVALDDAGNMVEMKGGDLYIIRYKQVQSLVQSDMAVLI